MELIIKRKFYELYNHCLNGNATLEDFSTLLINIRSSLKQLDNEALVKLLDIISDIFENEISIREYVDHEAEYFAKNALINSDDSYLRNVGEKFYKNNFDKYDFTELLDYLKKNISKSNLRFNLEFILRNFEVVLRDDAKLLDQNRFKVIQKLYGSELKKIFKF